MNINVYKRDFKINKTSHQSFFLFGPRGVGKTTWLKKNLPNSIYLDLLNSKLYRELLSRPETLETYIPPNFKNWVVLDEIQKIPELLNEVHRLIEEKQIKFVLTGSSARILRKKGVNLLAGRALTYYLYPLTRAELKTSFNLNHSLKFGNLPLAYTSQKPKDFLNSYIKTYLQEEILQEGLTRNIGNFSRFLETASFSQGEIINYSEIARNSQLSRKTVEDYFSILSDLLIAFQIPVFRKKAKRRLIKHNKFYFFDTGVFRTIRPQGPLDSVDELEGASLETLFFQEIIALNQYHSLDYKIYYWRTSNGQEVDIILYGPKGFFAIEIKRKSNISTKDLSGLKSFSRDYPEAKLLLFCFTQRKEYRGNITITPIQQALDDLLDLLKIGNQ